MCSVHVSYRMCYDVSLSETKIASSAGRTAKIDHESRDNMEILQFMRDHLRSTFVAIFWKYIWITTLT